MEHMLAEFADVFKEDLTEVDRSGDDVLPEVHHAITLMPGAQPP
jgi:hypothetical protein